MQKIICFAIFFARRLEEITRISWKHLDAEGSRALVRDMKNPGRRLGMSMVRSAARSGSNHSLNAEEARRATYGSASKHAPQLLARRRPAPFNSIFEIGMTA